MMERKALTLPDETAAAVQWLLTEALKSPGVVGSTVEFGEDNARIGQHIIQFPFQQRLLVISHIMGLLRDDCSYLELQDGADGRFGRRIVFLLRVQ